jgi:dTDP-4-amino-4,6-dideoxygalactose transaminase
MLKYFAPSGSPIKTIEFIYWIICNIFFIDKRPSILREIEKNFKIDHGYMLTTGRGAMTLLLKSLRELSNSEKKYEVIVPAYTCYSVASSIINAGLKIKLCDINPDTLSYDMDKLNQMSFDNVLCIISANLYGIPNQLVELERLADLKKIYLIDDAAQAFDAECSDRKVGTFGVAGLFSFDKGKNITSIEGGVIVTNNKKLSEIINKHYIKLSNQTLKGTLSTLAKVCVYYFFINPFLYWLPASLPFLNLGKTRFEEEIEILKYSRLVAPLALKQILRSNEIKKKRIKNGIWYQNSIKENTNIKKIKEKDNTNPVYLRYPVKIKNKDNKIDILDRAKRYGVTMSYPKSLNKLEEIQKYVVNPGVYRGAEEVSDQLITLPTHLYINEITIKKIVELIY